MPGTRTIVIGLEIVLLTTMIVIAVFALLLTTWWPKAWRRAMGILPFPPANDGRYATILTELDRLNHPDLADYRTAIVRAIESNEDRDCHMAYAHRLMLSRKYQWPRRS